MIDYLISTHDVKLLNTCNYKSIIDPKYLLLGNNHSCKNNQNTIICNCLTHNIENFPFLCSYTGWYAVSKNKLHNYNTVCLLEYDSILSEDFHISNMNIVQQQNNNRYIISYSNTLTDHYVFYKSTPWLEIALKKIYNIDIVNFVSFNKDQLPMWPTTTNITMPVDVLDAFIEWFSPMTDIFKHDRLGAYVHERAFFIFCATHNISIIYNKSKLIHKQLKSHKINDIYGQILEKYNSTTLEPYMKSEYDKTYNQFKNYLSKTIK